jgi:hypothetical protein
LFQQLPASSEGHPAALMTAGSRASLRGMLDSATAGGVTLGGDSQYLSFSLPIW